MNLELIGHCVSTSTVRPVIALIDGPSFDATGHQRASRINGSFVCPRCELVWPLIEDVEVWVQGSDLRWYANEWGTGHGFCEECQVAVFEGFDCDYVIDCG